MIYLEIPYVSENKRINKISLQGEIQNLQISQESKASVFDAVFNYFPKQVDFDNENLKELVLLEGILHRFGVPYRRIQSQ
jgi:hypothetical protein